MSASLPTGVDLASGSESAGDDGVLRRDGHEQADLDARLEERGGVGLVWLEGERLRLLGAPVRLRGEHPAPLRVAELLLLLLLLLVGRLRPPARLSALTLLQYPRMIGG